MSETLTAVKSAPTTTPRDTYIEVEHSLTDGVLLYRPEDNSFIALYPDEWLECRADGHQNKTAIEELQDANRAVTEKSLALQHLLQQPNPAKADIAQAQKELDEALNTLSQKSEAAKKRVEAITNQKTDPKKAGRASSADAEAHGGEDAYTHLCECPEAQKSLGRQAGVHGRRIGRT
jgi:chromosome segregation ATPase